MAHEDEHPETADIDVNPSTHATNPGHDDVTQFGIDAKREGRLPATPPDKAQVVTTSDLYMPVVEEVPVTPAAEKQSVVTTREIDTEPAKKT